MKKFKFVSCLVCFGMVSCSHFEYINKWASLNGELADENALQAAMRECRFNKLQQDYYHYIQEAESSPRVTGDGSYKVYLANQAIGEAYWCMEQKGFVKIRIKKDDPRLISLNVES